MLEDKTLDNSVKTSKIHDILNVPYDVDINVVTKYIFDKRFKAISTSDSVKTFDYLIDFDLIYANFKKYYEIDLITDNLDWWKFTAMLDDLFLTENSLTTRIGYRSKPPKETKHNKEQVKFLREMYSKYRISNNNIEEVQKGFGNLFGFLKTNAKKVGD